MFSGPESTRVTAFVEKLWQMVCDPKYDDLISWCDKGSSFIIKDQNRFCSELLPMFYKHNNMASFIRQLNKYGFRKVNPPVTSASLKGDVSDFEFSHPHFIKDCPFLLDQIKRRVSNTRDISVFKSDQGLLTKLLLEVQQLQQKQSAFESRISSMKAENDALWREHSILRQKHQKQQKIVNRLIHFLLSLVHQTRGVNVKRRNMPLMLKDGTCLSIEELGPSKDRHFPTTSPVICEIDPDDVLIQPKPQQLPNNQSNVGVLIPVQAGEDNLLTNQLVNTDQIILNEPSSSVIPISLDDVPTIVLESNINNSKTVDNSKISIPANVQSIKSHNKRPLVVLNDENLVKVRKINSSVQNEDLSKISASTSSVESTLLDTKPISQRSGKMTFNKKTGSKSHGKGVKKKSLKSSRNNKIPLETIDLSNDSGNDQLLKEDAVDPLKLDSEVVKLESDVASVNLFNDEIEYPIESSSLLSSEPIVLSPSGTEVTSSLIEDPLRIEEKNKNNSLVLSDNNTTLTKQDVENHIDLMQSDIDALKEILHGEGLSLDASAIMGLFNSDDPLSLNMPEAGKDMDNLNHSAGNELVSYSSPSLIDLADSLNDDDQIANSPSSFIDEMSSTLNTPQVSYGNDFPSPSASKRLMKSITSLLDLLQKAT